MQVSIVELWDDLLEVERGSPLPSNIFESAAYLGVPDQKRGPIWLHLIQQREERTGYHHDSDFKVSHFFYRTDYRTDQL